jgi:hypothetical protein
VLAAVTATYTPAAPAVGDLITVRFTAPVTLEASPDYEVVRRDGASVVVRTFRPAPFVMHGVVGGVRFENLVVPVRSVLDPNQPMTPAPLVPPRAVPYPRAPFYVLAVAALAALAIWILVWRRARAAESRPVAVISPEVRFRDAVLALRGREATARWARLADETRRYLAATRPALGSELTTRELLPRLAERERIVEAILRQGDLEKFSTRGPEPLAFDEIAARALALAENADSGPEAVAS